MKIISYSILNTLANRWAIGLLLLALFSCNDANEESLAATDSLSPTANYEIKGKVVSEKDEAIALPNILIEIIIEKPSLHIDSLYTGNDGGFDWSRPITTFNETASFSIAATDTSGRYEQKRTSISFTKEEVSNAASWFLGEGKKEITIKLREKE
ncbi:putative lipoprotein (rSAM/lipoprotein system) [Parabacteroides sp. PF5-5]|uniref:radical SAM-associated putative lipoprotein n=1 Tax=unclassified Parabacteroides TaxID=2649774 RepID=UPI0024730C1F|nr:MULTISPECIES: radical SAM-associated putative lipoprotein [unclassified Parabacteroides]MDH6306614.1 putative lipoprotein (rSAM/lipoprotein system) [Parabacteroides sp. PH5-39]MDH6317581.1 putative lipoprotein (rSAM/lipoprotein system) [Parabacteroides sp. PF5-13]MDH6321325.1 putative lipoprotein (rSAM/lipoprotein system) [Parabacteroides sp. PH5-13]MDH6325110.1 putative lipoprotein (rSAM/lipoprotein system) [Parabacteroides sp. PH5-8]MDH6328819.1 putative lipoprotein (rSAM/lipoprotein syst